MTLLGPFSAPFRYYFIGLQDSKCVSIKLGVKETIIEVVYSYSETLVKMKPDDILNNFECFEFDQENGSTIEVIRSKYLSHQLIWKTPTKKNSVKY